MPDQSFDLQSSGSHSVLLSIIIPTKNRPDYCLSVLTYLKEMTAEAVEILVVDNSQVDMADRVAALGNPRIRYSHTSKPLSVNENFNQAIDKAQGRYITLLGDDDGVHPGILDLVQKAEQLGIDAITTTRPAQYYWPDIKFRLYGKAFSGKLELNPFTGSVTQVDPLMTLDAVLDTGAEGTGEMPKAYYGVVRKTCLESLKRQTGAICRISPDMSMSVGLVFHVKSMVCIDFPIFLPGSSARSGAGMGASGKHRGRLEDQPHLSAGDIAQWCPQNPRFFSGATIWAEACLSSVAAAGKGRSRSGFAFLPLYARCLAFEPDQREEVMRTFYQYCAAEGKAAWPSLVVLGVRFIGIWLARFWTIVRNLWDLAGMTPKKRFQAEGIGPALQLLAAKADPLQVKWPI